MKTLMQFDPIVAADGSAGMLRNDTGRYIRTSDVADAIIDIVNRMKAEYNAYDGIEVLAYTGELQAWIKNLLHK
jgi:hypothetical protein